jgi:DNA-binding winged helix-turn-helix (wHTH) protein
MQVEQDLCFGPHRLDLGAGQLWRDQEEVKLTPKALAVLRVLVARPGQVVTKDELFQTVWLQTVVSDDALTTCILELRHALRDNAKQPRYIETVHRRGYRFISPVAAPAASVPSSKFQVQKPETRFLGRRTPDCPLRTQHSAPRTYLPQRPVAPGRARA